MTDESFMAPGLAALLHPLREADFLERYWPQAPLHTNGPAARYEELFELPELFDARKLLFAWQKEAAVVLPGTDDEYHTVTVDAQSALKLHEQGMSVFLSGAETEFPVLLPWLANLRFALGLPASTKSRCLIYVSARERRTNTHFDANANFVLQMTGRKRWWLAPNSTLELPTHRHSLSMPGLHPELASYQQGELPKEMPSPATQLELVPGSLLFVPSGYWHATQADESSISLNFTFDQVTWADLFCRSLRKRLILDRTWREAALGAESLNPDFRPAAAARASAFLQRLHTVVEELQAQDFLANLYSRSLDSAISIDQNLVTIESQFKESRIECERIEMEIFEWVAHRNNPFTEAELVANGFPLEQVLAVLATLLDLQVLYLH